MKKVLVTIALLGFGFSAQADHNYEIQINGGTTGMAGLGAQGGTAGTVTINDDKVGDNTPWSLGAEVYKSMGENLQVGGLLSLADTDTTGSDTTFALGVVARYNFDADHRNSMFAGGGLTFNDIGTGDFIGLHLQFGKRYALSDTITYTPNVTYTTAVSGEFDGGGDIEGSSIVINLLSFSGFM